MAVRGEGGGEEGERRRRGKVNREEKGEGVRERGEGAREERGSGGGEDGRKGREGGGGGKGGGWIRARWLTNITQPWPRKVFQLCLDLRHNTF